MRCKKNIGVVYFFVLCIFFISCTSVQKDSFILSVDNYIPGEISFCEQDIHLNIDYVKDSLIQGQIFQVIDPKIKTYNNTCTPGGNKGRLVLKINQLSFWEGIKQRYSLAITGEIYDENQRLLLQETVLVSGKDHILQVGHQNKYLIPLVNTLIEGWKLLSPIKGE